MSIVEPGLVLGGRYQLADLLDDVEGAWFWRAVDQVLERSVTAYVVARSDPRAGDLLEAARRSATITDPHLLRVLDADVDASAGLTWVINEWGSGQSLDHMVSRDVLPPDRAAWLVREVAAAVAVAHRHDLAHGRLAPENVMVTESGTVRLIGFALDAAVQRSRLRSGNYPDCTPQEADLFDLAGLLYTGLVGCWPGASGSLVKPAPRDARGPLRPRQVRAGVPPTLDAICGRVLGRRRPDRSAHQLAAVLTEYIGELAVADPTVLPVALPEMDASLDDLAAATGRTDPETAALAQEQPVVAAQPDDTTPPLVDATVEAPVEAPVDPLPEQAWADVAWEEQPTQVVPEAAPEPVSDPSQDPGDDTQQAPPLRDLDDPDWHRPRADPGPEAPPLEPLPERALFAPEGTRRTPRGEVRPSVTSGWGTEVAAARLVEEGPDDEDRAEPEDEDDGWDVLPATRRPSWPLGHDDPDEVPDDWEERTRRPWLRLPLVVTVLAVLAVLAAGAVAVLHRTDLGGLGDGLGDGADPSASASAQPTSGQRLRIAGVADLDPFGVPPEENPDEAGDATDGDPATAWQTVTYRGRPDLGGLKPGVGLVVDLGSIQRIGSVDLRLVGAPTGVSIFAAPTASGRPSGIEGLTRVARNARAGTTTTLGLRQPVRTRYVVVWLTSLPQVDGGYRGGVAEIIVRS